MLKVAAYARVSTDKEDQINSLTNQREYFESYIKSKDDWEFVKVYFDEGITGTQTKKRKGFNRMIDDCKNGKIDLILTKEVSRFARNTVDTLNYTRMLKEYDGDKDVLWKTVLCSEITVLSGLILMTVYCRLMKVRRKLSN